MPAPDVLVVGNVVKDVSPDGFRPGGAAIYAACQSSRLGLRTAVVTRCSTDFRPETYLPDIEWHTISSPETTTFDNQYSPNGRLQRVSPATGRIGLDDLPVEWLKAPIILLGPVLDEIDVGLPRRFAGRGALVGLGSQGWLRRLDGDRVLPGRVVGDEPWLAGDVVFVSQEDVVDAEAVAAWRERVPVVVLTRAGRGCTVWDAAGRHDLPPFETEETDPTGAGDVFAVAFLVAFAENRDAPKAALFASAAASLAVRGAGFASIGDRAAIEVVLHATAPEPGRRVVLR
jgi:sugar/nucleoside kinase (ribokinase family)